MRSPSGAPRKTTAGFPAIFVFESPEGLEAFERILLERDFWDVLSAWEHSAEGEPRIARLVYEWPEHKEAER